MQRSRRKSKRRIKQKVDKFKPLTDSQLSTLVSKALRDKPRLVSKYTFLRQLETGDYFTVIGCKKFSGVLVTKNSGSAGVQRIVNKRKTTILNIALDTEVRKITKRTAYMRSTKYLDEDTSEMKIVIVHPKDEYKEDNED